MEGIRTNKELRGIIPNSFQHIFDKINLSSDIQYLVRVSYLEIYNEVIRDLLSDDPKAKLDLKEHPDKGVYVKDLSQKVVRSVEEMDNVMNVGNSNRTVGFTAMNATSSRSHSIFSITVESSSPGPDGKPHIKAGKLHLVDLAGSERQEKTGATGIRLKEATKINLSLSALGNVISALVDGKAQHIPYRDSKLTRLLQDSLGGNSKTVMVANLGPAEYNYDETMSTLRYANRAKNIKNKPKINEDPKDALLREYQEEIEKLKAQLLLRQNRGSGGGSGGGSSGAGGAGGAGGRGGPEVVRVKDTEAIERMRKEKEAEMRAFLERKDIATNERKKIEEELRASEQRKNMAEMEQKELEARLKEVQDRVMGGQNIIDETKKQEAKLRQTAADLEKKALEEKMLKRQLAEAQENSAVKEEKYSSLQQEADVKSKKLKKLVAKLTEAKAEIRDVQSEWQREKEDMLDSVRDLTNQLKLKLMIIENFVPKDEAVRLEQRATWDEDVQIWRTKPIALTDPHVKSQRPTSAIAGSKRPVSEYARMAKTAGGDNPRFKTDNIISLSLDMPERTTRDYTVPAVGPRVQAALSAALAEEDDVTMGSPNSYSPKNSPKTRSTEDSNEGNYPKARGLLSRAGRR
eukprot:Phypoly_transcript_04460.p1 GENE.Phypoly_transcript_04460~~Phypoly_transcript_04460.p1  ORF type:complete len:706 (+),score=158.05 Phypoly_transcript_04460:223-2118(+)